MARNWQINSKNWGGVIAIIHWLTAFFVVGIFILGLWMMELDYYDKWYTTAPFIHKSIGICILFLTIIRLAYRVLNKKTPAPLPTHKKVEIKLANLMHKALYALLFAVTISGYLMSTAKGQGISVFGLFEVPALPWQSPIKGELAADIHFFIACFLIGFASLHAMAALKHHFIEKDNTLKKMLGI